jgi:quercetin dioxygenase-like cupin family protein
MADAPPPAAAHKSASIYCRDLDAAIAFYEEQGFRLDMIMPADAPRLAVMSGDRAQLRLEIEGAQVPLVASAAPAFAITRSQGIWSTGRAGMQYRDLIPDRLGGRVIASQIRIPEGGLVPDYVHYHRVGFQVIYCRRGWVRVVYEDQGSPFVMHEGDCVLQPPGIRHRVLEASAGLEVIEVSAPAEHETFRDHELALPTASVRPDRLFGGQSFVRHIAAGAIWRDADRFEACDTGIAQATGGIGSVRVLRASAGASGPDAAPLASNDALTFLFVLEGRAQLRSEALGVHALDREDACVIPVGAVFALEPAPSCAVLEVMLALPRSARICLRALRRRR